MLAETFPGWMEVTADAVRRAVEDADRPAAPKHGTRSILFMARQLRRAIRLLHTQIRDEIDSGVEATSFVTHFAPVAESLGSLHSKLETILSRVSEPALRGLHGRLKQILQASESEVFETRRWLAKYLAAARKPLPPLDQESLRRGRADAADGRTENVVNAIARLEAGGDL